MSGEGLAGRLRERVTVSRQVENRDSLGTGGGWETVRDAWAEVRPEARGPVFAGDGRSALPAWRVTMRRAPLAVGERIEWGERRLIVREVRDDPALPDRIVGIAEEER